MARTSFAALIGAVVLAGIAASIPLSAQVIGVSWSNFQEERWKTDEAAIKAAIAAGRRQLHLAPTRRARPRSSSPTSKA